MQPQQVISQATTTFFGTRWRLLAILLSGYILMLLTLGIYRFWLVTKKRLFYWSHTRVDGESLEYTGTAVQLLVGFLLALTLLVPMYVFFFYLSTQTRETAIIGYIGVAIFMFFLSGYAAYRARRFLLTRTLWRGIRFSLSGSAWAYALRRFFWVILTIVTLGLAYPFMATSLWRYRYNNTWFGDRQFHFTGTWRTIAGPFYLDYFVILGLVIYGLYLLGISTSGVPLTAKSIGNNMSALGLFGIAAMFASFAYFHLKARIVSRMLSTVSIGKAKLNVTVRARALLGQHIVYSVLLGLVTMGFLILVGYIMGDVLGPLLENRKAELGEVLQLGWYNLAIFGLIYLAFLAVLAILAELVFGLGYWRLVARGAVIENEKDLRTIRAKGQESTLAGQGLADALNVGAY